ncbi:MAG: quinol oxidase [Gammaproteobacteria bacterium]|nr:quinol oxidase [Gammaproteobacteria bacterium]
MCLVLWLSIPVVLPVWAQDHAQEPPWRAVVDADGRQRVQMVGGSYFFKPSHIIVKANLPVVLSVRLEPGIIPHTLVIKAPEAGVVIDELLSTEAKTFVFTFSATGTYPFYCRNKLLFFKSHRAKGMEGVFEVVE